MGWGGVWGGVSRGKQSGAMAAEDLSAVPSSTTRSCTKFINWRLVREACRGGVSGSVCTHAPISLSRPSIYLPGHLSTYQHHTPISAFLVESSHGGRCGKARGLV